MKYSNLLKKHFGENFSLCSAIGDIIQEGAESTVLRRFEATERPKKVLAELKTELETFFSASNPMLEKITWKNIVESGVPPKSLESVVNMLKDILNTEGGAVRVTSKEMTTHLPNVWNYIELLMHNNNITVPASFRKVKQEVDGYVLALKKTKIGVFQQVARLVAGSFLTFLKTLHGKVLDTIQNMSRTFVMMLEALKIDQTNDKGYRFAVSKGWFFFLAMTDLNNVMKQDNAFVKDYVIKLSESFTEVITEVTPFVNSIPTKAIEKTSVFFAAGDVVSDDRRWVTKHFSWLADTIKTLSTSVHAWFGDFFAFMLPIFSSWFGEQIFDAYDDMADAKNYAHFPKILEKQERLKIFLKNKKISRTRKNRAAKTLDASHAVLGNMFESWDFNLKQSSSNLKQTKIASNLISKVFLDDDIDPSVINDLFKARTGFDAYDFMALQQDTDIALALQLLLTREDLFVEPIGIKIKKKNGKGKEEEDEEEEEGKLSPFDIREIKRDAKIIKRRDINEIAKRTQTVADELENAMVRLKKNEHKIDQKADEEFEEFNKKFKKQAKKLSYEGYNRSEISVFKTEKSGEDAEDVFGTAREKKRRVRDALGIDLLEERYRRLKQAGRSRQTRLTLRRGALVLLLLFLFGGLILFVTWDILPSRDTMLSFLGLIDPVAEDLTGEETIEIVTTAVETIQTHRSIYGSGSQSFLKAGSYLWEGGRSLLGYGEAVAKETGIFKPVWKDAYRLDKWFGGGFAGPRYTIQMSEFLIRDGSIVVAVSSIIFESALFIADGMNRLFGGTRETDDFNHRSNAWWWRQVNWVTFAVNAFFSAEIAMQFNRLAALSSTSSAIGSLLTIAGVPAGGAAFLGLGAASNRFLQRPEMQRVIQRARRGDAGRGDFITMGDSINDTVASREQQMIQQSRQPVEIMVRVERERREERREEKRERVEMIEMVEEEEEDEEEILELEWK